MSTFYNIFSYLIKGDEYFAGLDCQWIDVTDLEPNDYLLQVSLNPDDFICEGLPIVKSDTLQVEWIQTDFKSSLNETVFREACKFTSNYAENNNLQTIVNFAGINSIVTLPCKRRATLSPTKGIKKGR